MNPDILLPASSAVPAPADRPTNQASAQAPEFHTRATGHDTPNILFDNSIFRRRAARA